MILTRWFLVLGFPLGLALGTPVKLTACPLEAGTEQQDITPDVARGPVWLAGFGQGRRATGVHDPLEVRALALRCGLRKVVLVAADLIGLFHEEIGAAREALRGLPGFDHVAILVAATHTHSGPDTLGLWGPKPMTRGVDDAYLRRIRQAVVAAAVQAVARLRPARLYAAQVDASDLLTRSRLPRVTDGTLTALRLDAVDTRAPIATVTTWGAHPEVLTRDNSLVSADFPHWVRQTMEVGAGGLALYFCGAIGTQTAHEVPVMDPATARPAPEGSFRKAELLGSELGRRALAALADAPALPGVPLDVRVRQLSVPLTNPGFRRLAEAGVIRRPSSLQVGSEFPQIRTEVSLLQIGEVTLIGVPGEIYPEIVRGGIQSPQDPWADFPGAPREEPPLLDLVPGRVKAVVGLADDELGCVIPKTEWNEWPPYAYGLPLPQYGEAMSASFDLGPLIHEAVRTLGVSEGAPHPPPRGLGRGK